MDSALLILRRLLAILVLAVFHLAASIYFVATAFIDSMVRFDTNAVMTTGQRFSAAMASSLTFPLVWLVDVIPGGWGRDGGWDVVLFCANSLLWGAAAYGGFRWIARRARAGSAQRSSPAPNP